MTRPNPSFCDMPHVASVAKAGERPLSRYDRGGRRTNLTVRLVHLFVYEGLKWDAWSLSSSTEVGECHVWRITDAGTVTVTLAWYGRTV